MGSSLAKVSASKQNENPFTDKRGEPASDLNVDLLEVLKRYDNIIRALVLRKVKMGGKSEPFKLLEREFTEDDIGKNIQTSLLDFSVSHAFQGKDYVGDILNNMQYTVLQAALILTITVTLYISPPAFDTETFSTLFSAVVGFSALCHLGCIICCTILTAMMNAAYTEIDGTIILLESYALMVVVTAFNYVAIVTTIIAMLVAGFARTYTQGYIQLAYSVIGTVILITTFIRSGMRAVKNQDTRAYMFYKEYCEMDGQLKKQYLDLVYPSDDDDKIHKMV
jgi:hypothetical protein